MLTLYFHSARVYFRTISMACFPESVRSGSLPLIQPVPDLDMFHGSRSCTCLTG
jgi:hypothetical protein